MKHIPVKAASHQYEVLIGEGILAEASAKYAEQFTKTDKIVVLTDERVWALQGEYFKAAFKFQFELYIMPAGEACKTFENFEKVQTFMLEKKCTRKSIVIAFGGGAVGDLTGFVAATYMRGISFYQVPTTILAHDSAVGGKTAINHPLGKNIIGAFHQPDAVLYDAKLLDSLPEGEVRSGMAEVVKHAMISDASWLSELMQTKVTELSKDTLVDYLAKGVAVKANIVEQDETEQSVRKYLNLGHTYGHALEAAAGYGRLAHGEAVMLGLVYCLLFSERYGKLTREFTEKFYKFAADSGYPFSQVAEYPFDQLAEFMMKDKKADYGELQFVLLDEIGKPFVQKVSLEECREIDVEFRQLVGVAQ